MNNPMNQANAGQRTRTQIAEMGEIQNRTIEDGRERKNTRSKRNPGAKQFAEPGDGDQDLAKV
jgi:hypothetical protein